MPSSAAVTGRVRAENACILTLPKNDKTEVQADVARAFEYPTAIKGRDVICSGSVRERLLVEDNAVARMPLAPTGFAATDRSFSSHPTAGCPATDGLFSLRRIR